MKLIKAVPCGKVATYVQIAALAGNYRAARQVAWVLHSSSRKYQLPWHRIINSRGGISLGSGRGLEEQIKLLKAEGVKFDRENKVNLGRYLWEPTSGGFEDFEIRWERPPYPAKRTAKRRRSIPGA